VRCRDFNRLMSLHLDGRLGEAEERALRDHVRRCPRCAKALPALEAAEKSARGAANPEPVETYWDGFSRRVMEKIDAREEAKERTGLARLTGFFFPPASRGLKVAAGVASIAIVIAAGVLYVERRGEGVVPVGMRAPLEKQETSASVNEGLEENGEAPAPIEEAWDEEAGAAKPPVGTGAAKEPGVVAAGEAVETKVEPPKLAEKKEAPSSPQVTESTSRETIEGATAERAAERRDASRELAGADEVKRTVQPPATESTSVVERPQSIRVVERAPSPDEAARSRAESFSIVEKDAAPATPVVMFTLAGGKRLPRIAEADTSIAEDELRHVIAAWKAHIEAHPTDSLNAEGYRQIAQAYVLLAVRWEDDAVADEGASLIQSYLERSEDAALRSFLAEKLREIESHKEK
jgi:anti-sigma factor RsiW